MRRHDFFIKAMQAGEYRRRAWVISAFSMIEEDSDSWKKNPYPFRIVQTRGGYFFVNETGTELIQLEDCDPIKPPFDHREQFMLKVGEIPNFTQIDGIEEIKTSYGQLFFNWVMVAYPFGNKIHYQTGRISPDMLEQIVLPRLQDDPQPGDPTPKSIARNMPIYVQEYLKMADAAFYLAGFTQLWVPAATRKSMTAPPGIAELKARLLEENAGRLHDPAVIAKIDAELIKYDSEYLKDDLSEGFLISGKSRKVVRRKLFLMTGAETGLEDNIDVQLIPNSLSEGWDIEKFPVMNDSLRAGSFNRGAETMLGGEAVKWLLRASSNMLVTEEDCHSTLGIPTVLTEDNQKRYIGFSVVTAEGHDKLSDETVGKYLGQRVMIRSPMFCRLEKTDYCSVCVGDRLAMSPTALSSAVSAYGSAFMLLFMKKMHGTSLSLAHMDYKTAIQ